MSGVDIDVLAAVAVGTGCGLVVLDEAGLIKYLSPQLEEVSGVQADQVVGKPWSELVPEILETGDEDAGAGLIDPAPVLSKVTFYPVCG